MVQHFMMNTQIPIVATFFYCGMVWKMCGSRTTFRVVDSRLRGYYYLFGQLISRNKHSRIVFTPCSGPSSAPKTGLVSTFDDSPAAAEIVDSGHHLPSKFIYYETEGD